MGNYTLLTQDIIVSNTVASITRVYVNITLFCDQVSSCQSRLQLSVLQYLDQEMHYNSALIMPDSVISPTIGEKHVHFDLNATEKRFGFALTGFAITDCITVSRVLIYQGVRFEPVIMII